MRRLPLLPCRSDLDGQVGAGHGEQGRGRRRRCRAHRLVARVTVRGTARTRRRSVPAGESRSGRRSRSRAASTRAESAGPRSESLTNAPVAEARSALAVIADSGRTPPDQGGSERIRTARTDEGHQRRPPWAVGTWSASRPRAIWPNVLPPACSERIRSATSEGTAGGRPTGARCGRGGTGRRRSARYRSSSSTGISTRPPSNSTVSTNGTTLRLTVDALTPSASAACTIEYASRSTLSAGRTAAGPGPCRRVF